MRRLSFTGHNMPFKSAVPLLKPPLAFCRGALVPTSQSATNGTEESSPAIAKDQNPSRSSIHA
jgi:hypothetical protein